MTPDFNFLFAPQQFRPELHGALPQYTPTGGMGGGPAVAPTNVNMQPVAAPPAGIMAQAGSSARAQPQTSQAAPQAQERRYLMGGGLGDFLRANQGSLFNLSAGLLGGREGLQQALANMPAAMQGDRAAADRQRQNAAIQQWIGSQNLSPEKAALLKAYPQLAAEQAFAQPETTNDIRNFQFAQGNPAFAQFVRGNKAAGATNVNVTSGDSFAKGLGGGIADEFLERRAAASEAVQSLQGIDEVRGLLDQGVITGFGADFRVGLGKALQAAGFNYAEDEVANSEAFVAAQAKEVGRIISLFGAGTGLSDKDREFATRAAAGDITMNEESIRRVLEINEKAARNVISNFNQDASRIPAGMSPYPLTIEAPSGLPAGVTEADIAHTMQVHGLTREQVLQQLRGR